MLLYVGTKDKSSWSLRPFLALAHAQIPFETRTIALDRPDTKAQIAAVTPTGRVPVLHDGAVVIWDSLAICEYAAELVPSLWPAERAQRARARALACEMHSSFAAIRRDMPMALLDARPGVGHTAEALADAARLQQIWRDALAASGGPFLFGAFSIADAMFGPVVSRFKTYGVALEGAPAEYSAAMWKVPAMQEWLKAAQAETFHMSRSVSYTHLTLPTILRV